MWRKKHRTIAALETQKIRRRGHTPFTPSFFKIFILLLRILSIIGKNASLLLKKVFNKIPTISYVVLIVACGAVCAKLSFNFVEYLTDYIPITSVQVNVGDNKIAHKIATDINSHVNKKKQPNRSLILSNIQQHLRKFDMLDQYWLRLGLDGVLQITATLQTPILMITGMHGKKIVISNRMQIMAPSALTNEYPTLLNVDAPELNLNTPANVSMNFPWLISQLTLINSEVAKMGIGYILTKIAWTSNAGFVLSLHSEAHELLAYIGVTNIPLKAQRLKSLLVTLHTKNTFPSEVDLDYADKATFKISPHNVVKSVSNWNGSPTVRTISYANIPR